MTDAPDIRTTEDFAAFVGISRPTVSKYFSDPRSVRPETRDRIEAAIELTNFRPNLLAANLKRSRTRVLGIIIPNATDPFYMALTQRIEAIAAASGYFAFMLSSNGRVDLEAEAIDRLQSMNVAGAIVVPVGAAGRNARLAALARRIPLVYIDSAPDDDEPFIGTDNEQSFGIMVEYLCRSGEPPCYLGMPDINRNAAARRNGYIRAMDRAGEKPRILPIPETHSWDFERFGQEITACHIADGLPTRTLLCANDRIAFGAQLAAWEVGLKIGRGSDCALRIAGHDDHPLSRYACPPLTTMAQNVADIGAQAISQLMTRLSGGAVEAGPAGARLLLSAELKLRASA